MFNKNYNINRLNMKKIILMMMVMMVSFASIAQNKDVTRFLGIPVDGTVASMKQKLKAKGFKQSPYNKNQLVGRFNGNDVYVHILENKGKVWRISVGDKNFTDEINVRIRFNNLCRQFDNNGKYIPIQNVEDYMIPDDTDVSYEMAVNKKRFEAAFFQLPSDTTLMQKTVDNIVQKKYTPEQIKNPTEEIVKDVEAIANNVMYDILSKRSVWFVINENFGCYSIMIHYENRYNYADGGDL